MPIGNVHWITGRALHLDLDPIGSIQFEVSLNDGSGKIVHFLKHLPFPIIKICLPMPRRMPTGARGAEDEELRVGRPLSLLNVAAVLTIGRLEAFGRQDGACHVTNLDTGFVEWRIRMSSNG